MSLAFNGGDWLFLLSVEPASLLEAEPARSCFDGAILCDMF